METEVDNFKIILNKIFELHHKYKNNPSSLNKFVKYITKDLPELLEDPVDQQIYKEKIESEKFFFIQNFLSDNSYYYIKSNDIFLIYDEKDYRMINEDDLWHDILSKIDSNHDLLQDTKHEIKDELILEIKKQSLDSCLPESITIQNIIKYLNPIFLNSKAETKYFLCLLGDNYLKKDTKLNIYTPKYCNNFLKFIEFKYGDYFNNGLYLIDNFTNNIVLDNAISCNRILCFKNNVENENLWRSFLNDNFFNLLAVSIHYSKRYENSDNYLKDSISKNIKSSILYLNGKNILNIVNDFKLSLIKKEGFSVNTKDMNYLWKIFLRSKNIYDSFLNKEKTYLFFSNNFDVCNNNFVGWYSPKIEVINRFKDFINENMKYSNDDEIELSEFTNVFNNINNLDEDVDENELMDMLTFYYEVNIENNIIVNFSCKLWNKKEDLLNCVKNKFGITSTRDITFTNAYKKYCLYLKNNKNKYIASKQYFEKYIIKFIDKEYIFNKKIKKSFWN